MFSPSTKPHSSEHYRDEAKMNTQFALRNTIRLTT